MENKYYVYAYLDPRRRSEKYGNEPFYIGRGKGDRWLSHLKEAEKHKQKERDELKNAKGINFFKINKINSILADNFKPQIIKLAVNLSLVESINLEKQLISEIGLAIFGAGPLVNLTYGGEHVNRVVCSGPLNSFFGKKHSDQTKAKISAIHKGKSLSTEQKAKISLALTSKKKSLQAKENYSASMKKRFQEDPSQETFQRLGNLNSKKWKIQSPDGEIFEIISLKSFCDKRSLSHKTLISAFNDNKRAVMFGKTKGWKILEKEI